MLLSTERFDPIACVGITQISLVAKDEMLGFWVIHDAIMSICPQTFVDLFLTK